MLDIHTCIWGLTPDFSSNETKPHDCLSTVFSAYFYLGGILVEACLFFLLTWSLFTYLSHIYSDIDVLSCDESASTGFRQVALMLIVHYRCLHLVRWMPLQMPKSQWEIQLISYNSHNSITSYPRAPKQICISSSLQGPKQMHLDLSLCIVFFIYHMCIFYCFGRKWWQQRNILLSVRAS